MPKNHSEELKNRCIELSKEGKMPAEIGRLLILPRTTVSSILKKQKETGTVRNMPKSGRPRITDARVC